MLNREDKRKLFKVPLTECLIYLSFGLLVFFLMKSLFVINSPLAKNESFSMAIYFPVFIFIIICLSLGFYFECKYNKLKFKNVFLYLGVAIALCNLVAVCALPNIVDLPNGATQTITTNTRIYSILYGFAIGIMPYLFFYVVPRKITHKKYMELVLFVFIVLVSIFVIISLFKDSKIYINAIKSKFSDMTTPVTSIFAHKNIFARMLMIGIFSSIIMHIYTNKWCWLLFIIPFFGIELFTFAKMPIFLTVLVLLFYFVLRIIPVVRQSKDNFYIFVMIASFVLIVGATFAVLIARSETGLFYSVKKMFLDFGESAKTTLHFRTIIWENTFSILKPFQYIIGYGIVPFATAIHNTYSLDPRREPDTANIWTSHNGFIETIAEGGVVYLLISLFMIAMIIYAAIKIYKRNKNLSVFIIGLIAINILHSLTDPIMLLNEGDALFLTALMVFPVFSLYYSSEKTEEIELRKSFVKDIKSLNDIEFKNKLLALNKKRLQYDARNIEKDYLNN